MSRESLRARSQRFFGSHGRFCASHPWEVIVTIVTLTVCALSMSVLSGGKVGTFCGPSKPCQAKPKAEEVRTLKLLGACMCVYCMLVLVELGHSDAVHSQQSGGDIYLQPVQQSPQGRLQVPAG